MAAPMLDQNFAAAPRPARTLRDKNKFARALAAVSASWLLLVVSPLVAMSSRVELTTRAAAEEARQDAPAAASSQSLERELNAAGKIEIRNRHGRVSIVASEEQKNIYLRAESPAGGAAIAERDVTAVVKEGKVVIEAARGEEADGDEAKSASGRRRSEAAAERDRIDLTLRVPARSNLKIETVGGAVDVTGNVASAEVATDTGTIRADVPTDALKYSFKWTASRPRFYSEVELSEVKERRGGFYEVAGRLGDKKAKRETRTELDLSTERGVVLFGVSDPASVPTDLRERALTESARAIIRSGNFGLIEAIRRLAPRLVGDYTETLPARMKEPTLVLSRREPGAVATRVGENLARFNASVTDRNGRAVSGLSAKDFRVFENGAEREVREVAPSSAPFNIVLLLDVSGSVEERLDFIRKAALSFLDTVGAQDRISIISFRDDIQIISEFTTDRRELSTSVKKIQAGGSTALYDALAYTLVHTLKPLRGERTGIVVLSDGDDNRSFVPFTEVLEATIESGAVVYPLYIPSGLIPATGAPAAATTVDPMRTRYLALTSRAHEEGRKLAEASGGVYYPITRLDQLQQAYDDVVAQLRTSYTITYASDAGAGAAAANNPTRVRLRLSRDDVAVRLSPAVDVRTNTP